MKNRKNISRRKFIKTTSSAAFAVNIIGCSKKPRKPNLLFLWTDEQRPDTMKAYGNHKIHAPNLNKLAAQSVVFQNAYVSQPVCTPSRSTVMSGLWPHQSGCIQNNIPLPAGVRCFPEIVNDSHYRTGYFGKWHLGDEIFAQHGFKEWKSIEDGYRKYYALNRDKEKKSDYWHFLKDLGYEPDTKNNDFSRGFAARRPLEHCKPKFLERQTIDFLKRQRNEPFMLYVNFLEPHMPFYGPLDNEHDPEEINIPPNFNNLPGENDPLRYRLFQQRYYEGGFNNLPLKTEKDWRRLIANYWGLVTQVDRSVGAILGALENLGLAEDTIVVYTSDHGDMMGAHRLLAKTVMYEESVKVPWLMRFPKKQRDQIVVKNAVSHIDLVPTLLELMEFKKEYDLPGKSLVPALRTETRKGEDVFVQWNPGSGFSVPPELQKKYGQEKMNQIANASIRTIVSADGWKLSLCDGDKSQLFNIKKDPYETMNLFYSGEYQDVIAKLSKRIQTWQESVGDTFQVRS
jgi:arylsulfatase A-like enzyme